MSYFERDLEREKLLGTYLDTLYVQKGLTFTRMFDSEMQKRGADLMYTSEKGKEYYIDEKAQLSYMGKSLPTFTFELSYMKNGRPRRGWLIDSSKITTHYFLVTHIIPKDEKQLEKGFRNCEVLSVDRRKLLEHLRALNLTPRKLLDYDQRIRLADQSGKIEAEELNSRTQGNFYYSGGLGEKPVNLQLRLSYIESIGAGKKLI